MEAVMPSGPLAGLAARLGQLVARRETIRYLVTSQLKAGHRDKFLGHLWSLLDPLLFILVYFLVFGVLFRQRAHGGSTEFLLYLSIGVLAWRFFDTTVLQAANCIRGHRGLIHEINFPKAIFPVSICLARLYDFVWGLIALLIVQVCVGRLPAPAAACLPLLVALQVLLTLGLAFVVAYLGAFFADTVNVVTVGLRLWFYASPVFYYARGPGSIIPEAYRPYYMLNPVACFFEAYRDVLLWGRLPEPGMLAYLAAVAVVAFLIGFALFGRGEGAFAKYV